MRTSEATSTIYQPYPKPRPISRWLMRGRRVLVGHLIILVALAMIGASYQVIATA